MRGSQSSSTSNVDQLATKTIDWLCNQPRAPTSVKGLLDQIDSLSLAVELPFEEVWGPLAAQGVVQDGDSIKYNLDVIQVEDG